MSVGKADLREPIFQLHMRWYLIVKKASRGRHVRCCPLFVKKKRAEWHTKYSGIIHTNTHTHTTQRGKGVWLNQGVCLLLLLLLLLIIILLLPLRGLRIHPAQKYDRCSSLHVFAFPMSVERFERGWRKEEHGGGVT